MGTTMPGKQTLVLLPGLDGTGLLFERLLAALPSDIPVHVIAYPTDRRLTLEEHAALVAERLPQGPLVLLAESFSGRVALKLLNQCGPCVEKVVFVASPSGLRPMSHFLLAPFYPIVARVLPWTPAFLLRYFCLGWAASASDARWLKGVLAQVPPAIITHRLRLVTSPTALPSDPPFTVPAIYLQAESDRLVPRNSARYFRACFSDFREIALPGPHFLLQADPAACAQRIAALVQGSPTQ